MKTIDILETKIKEALKMKTRLEENQKDLVEEINQLRDSVKQLEVDREKTKQVEKDLKDLLERIKKVLDDKVKDVRITHRLTSSPACLVADENDMGRHLEQVLQASGQHIPGSKPILEINPEHLLVDRVKQETNEKRFADWSQILFDQALLSEGGQLEDPADFVHRLNEVFLLLGGNNNEDVK